MQIKVGKFFWINLIVLIVSIQVVVLINYWYFIFKNVSNASINDTIAYQGRLVSTTGTPLEDGPYNMRFSIYDNDEGGTELWEEVWNGSDLNSELIGVQGGQVQLVGGIFNVELNSLCGDWQGSCKKNTGVDFDSPSLYLQVELDADGNNSYEETFSPRKRFSSIAYAMNSDRVNGKSVGSSGNSIPLLDAENTWSGVNTITSVSAGNKGLIIRGAESQSANLQEWQLGDGSLASGITADGSIFTPRVISPIFVSDQSEGIISLIMAPLDGEQNLSEGEVSDKEKKEKKEDSEKDNASNKIKIPGQEESPATAFIFDTPSEYTKEESKLFSIRNNGQEMVGVDASGNLGIEGSVTSSGLNVTSNGLGSDRLAEFKNFEGQEIVTIEKGGAVVLGSEKVSSILKLSGGAITNAEGALTVTGLLPTAGVSAPTGITFALSTEEQSLLAQRGMYLSLSGKYASDGLTTAALIENTTSGLGSGVLVGAEANYGLQVRATGLTTGGNAGIYTSAANGDVNVGLYSSSLTAKDGASNIGLISLADNQALITPGLQLGGYIGLGGMPENLTSAGLIVDNGLTTFDSLKVRDNGLDVLTVAHGGLIGIGTNLPVRTLDIKLPLGSSEGLGLYTNDFVKDNLGSSLVISPLSSSSDTSFKLQVYNVGEASTGNLLIQSEGGLTSFGAPHFDGTVNITSISTTTKGLTIRAIANQASPLLEVQNSDGNPLLQIDSNGMIISKVPQGTAPFDIDSNTKVNHLNADLLDGFEASDFMMSGSGGNFLNLSGGTMSGALTLSRIDRITDVVTEDSVINITGNRNVYSLKADSGDTEGSLTTIYNLTDVTSDAGRDVTIFLRALKGVTAGVFQHTVIVQFNGTTVMTIFSPFSSGAVNSDESRIFRYNPNTSTWVSTILN